MKPPTIKQIIDEYEDADPIKGLSARLARVGSYTDPEKSKYGSSWQLLEIEDDTGKISVSVDGKEEVKSDLIGAEVQIACYKHEQHGWIGAKRGTTQRGEACIKVSSTGTLEFAINRDEPAPKRNHRASIAPFVYTDAACECVARARENLPDWPPEEQSKVGISAFIAWSKDNNNVDQYQKPSTKPKPEPEPEEEVEGPF